MAEVKKESGNIAGMLFKVVLGLLFLVLAVFLLISRAWWEYSWLAVKACAGPFLILVAVLLFAIAKE